MLKVLVHRDAINLAIVKVKNYFAHYISGRNLSTLPRCTTVPIFRAIEAELVENEIERLIVVVGEVSRFAL